MKNSFIYQERIDHLRTRKFAQTREKIEVEGLLDEDDYGRVLPPKMHGKAFPIILMVLSMDWKAGPKIFAV